MSLKRGFTLIELLVVIAIIGILATIVVVELGIGKIKAKNSLAQSDITEIAKSVELYKNNELNLGTILRSDDQTYDAISVLESTLNDKTGTGVWNNILGTSAGIQESSTAYAVQVNSTPSVNYSYVYDTDGIVKGPGYADTYYIFTNIKPKISGNPDTYIWIKNGAVDNGDAIPELP